MLELDEATKLISKFYLQLPNNGGWDGLNSIPKRWNEGVRCAITLCEEMIKEQCKGSEHKDPKYQDERIEYWTKLKEEIDTRWDHKDESLELYNKSIMNK